MNLDIRWVPPSKIRANPWNPNEMSPEMFLKERASIREFGFIDPITAREVDDEYQIIDGEQRYNAGLAEGITLFPLIVLDVTEDEAKELTVILNDTRGQFREDRLSELLQDLASRREQARMEALLPYSHERLDQLLQRRTIDWDDLEKRRQEMQKGSGKETDPWVERVFRMPRDAAQVLDRAIASVRSQEGFAQAWQALEMIAADFLAGVGDDDPDEA